MMKRAFYIAIYVLYACLPVPSMAEEDGVDVLAIEYPPFTGQSLPGFGLSFRLLQAYAQKHMKVDVRPRIMPPARVQVALREGSWCLSFYPPKTNAEFTGFIPLSDQWVDLGLFRRVGNDKFVWTELSDLQGGKVAIFRTPSLGALHTLFWEAGLQLVFIDHLEQAFKLLISRRVDYVFADRFAAQNVSYAQKHLDELQFGETLLRQTQVGFFYNKSCASALFRSHL